MSGFLRKRHACIVLGMHRSGTSVLAQLLAGLGADLPLVLNPPAPDNPEGYFEPAALVAIHDDLLSAGGSAWFDLRPFAVNAVPHDRARALTEAMARALEADYAAAALPLIKDPRMCRFFPLSREVLAASGMDCSVVLALRPPAEVAASLARRDQISAAYAGVLWARHVISAERDTRDLPRVAVCYEEMLADWRATAARVRRLPGPWNPSDPERSPLKEELRHHSSLSATDVFGTTLGPLLDELYAALAALTGGDEGEQRARIDAAAADVLAAAHRETRLFEAEFLHRRLAATNPFWRSSDPLGDRQALAAIFDSLHTGRERDLAR
ncbi:hypothetical protein V5F38_18520 [Xanthobacter sp. V0B-10]|uniref:sulfotransferase family protein n=1 Tax=Xanthobacter albus TaxID=3119929 RepID=UPI003727921C